MEVSIIPTTFLVSIIFKIDINPKFLVDEGYEIIRLTTNPYLVDIKN